jgi:hypothetical protein
MVCKNDFFILTVYWGCAFCITKLLFIVAVKYANNVQRVDVNQVTDTAWHYTPFL